MQPQVQRHPLGSLLYSLNKPMSEPDYTKREMDAIITDIKEGLSRIEAQTVKHNGRLSKVERYLLIVGCVSGTILLMNGSEFVSFLGMII